jgi:tetratricopeptide (TPR) repeat protein
MRWFLIAALIGAPLLAQQPRIASDFEIAQMKQQIARSRDFVSQLSGHLNLGDLYLTRSETATARAEYAKALEIAGDERLAARKASDITRYATATAYAALANAKLGYVGPAFNAAEEAIRYTSGSAKSWNLYSAAMTLLHRPQKAASAARNAVAIASREVAKSPSVANKLDLAVYEYSLASSLIDSGDTTEGERLLRTVTSALRSSDFASLRRDVARKESFEIYSSARGDEAAYLSLANRAGLRLSSLLEQRGDLAGARGEYEKVLEMRTDDPTALAALARLSTADERERYFAAAFDANPFSIALVREYQRHLAAGGGGAPPGDDSTGAQVRTALVQMQRGEMRAARETLDALLLKFPNNDTLRTLRREAEVTAEAPAFLASKSTNVVPTEAELRQLIGALQADKLTPEQRTALDRIAFTSRVTFDAGTPKDGQTIFESGRIGDVRFRFSEPIAFAGTFGREAKLTYRILGATDSGLLLEPVRLER